MDLNPVNQHITPRTTNMFKFKEFSISQERAAMKIGTDGVLLGAWTPLEHPKSILDIGAGTGLIALMLAQRSDAELIDAIELEEEAYEECVENFEASPWGDRLFCYHADLRELINEEDLSYDLIVSNPPFHRTAVVGDSTKRTTARQTESLPFELLLVAVNKLLDPNGVFSCIIPYQEEEYVLRLARQINLFPFKITRVKGRADRPIKRSLLALSYQQKHYQEEELIIEHKRHQYTEDYKRLTKAFYLSM